MKNAYPELPEVQCHVSAVPMLAIVVYLRTIPYITEVKRATYIIIRNESANGTKFLSNNGIGQQSDGARLPSRWVPFITGTFTLRENQTNLPRRFCAFSHWKVSADLLADRVLRRGLFIGEKVNGMYYRKEVVSPETLAQCYYDEWVTGSVDKPPPANFVLNFVSMYKQSVKLFPNGE